MKRRTWLKIRNWLKIVRHFVELYRKFFVTWCAFFGIVALIEMTGNEVPSLFAKIGLFFIWWCFALTQIDLFRLLWSIMNKKLRRLGRSKE